VVGVFATDQLLELLHAGVLNDKLDAAGERCFTAATLEAMHSVDARLRVRLDSRPGAMPELSDTPWLAGARRGSDVGSYNYHLGRRRVSAHRFDGDVGGSSVRSSSSRSSSCSNHGESFESVPPFPTFRKAQLSGRLWAGGGLQEIDLEEPRTLHGPLGFGLGFEKPATEMRPRKQGVLGGLAGVKTSGVRRRSREVLGSLAEAKADITHIDKLMSEVQEERKPREVDELGRHSRHHEDFERRASCPDSFPPSGEETTWPREGGISGGAHPKRSWRFGARSARGETTTDAPRAHAERNAGTPLSARQKVPPHQQQPRGHLQEVQESVRLQMLAARGGTEEERRALVKRLLVAWHPDRNPGSAELATAIFQYVQQERDLLLQV